MLSDICTADFDCIHYRFPWPFIWGIYLSFCKFTTVTDANLLDLPTMQRYWRWGFHSFFGLPYYLQLYQVLLINVLAFAVAMLTDKEIKGTNIFRTVFFMPNLIGGIVLGYIWQLLLNGLLAHLRTATYIFFKIWFLGIIILMLAADWIYDDHLHRRSSEYSW